MITIAGIISGTWLEISHSYAGETPVLHAARQGHTGTAKFLVEHGADPNIPSELGATALHHAAGIGMPFDFATLSCLFFSYLIFGWMVVPVSLWHILWSFLVFDYVTSLSSNWWIFFFVSSSETSQGWLSYVSLLLVLNVFVRAESVFLCLFMVTLTS